MITNHSAAAERLLDDALEWGRQAEEPTPEVGELTCLAYAAVHALLALHDALTASDRYAANEAKQWEAAQEATGDDLSAPEGESGSEEGGEAYDASEPLLCPECGEGISDHPVWDDACSQRRCRLTAPEVARALIERAVEDEREARIKDLRKMRDWAKATKAPAFQGAVRLMSNLLDQWTKQAGGRRG